MRGCDDAQAVYQPLNDWFATQSGENLAKIEAAEIAQLLPTHFGVEVLCISEHELTQLCFKENLAQCYTLSRDPKAHAQVMASPLALPFPECSFDFVWLAHSVEASSDPQTLISQAVHCVKDSGYIILSAFNRWSLWGMAKALHSKRLPYQGLQFYSRLQLNTWLKACNCHVITHRTAVFNTVAAHERASEHAGFLEALGRFCWPSFGAVHIVIAKKKRLSAFPLHAVWDKKRVVSPKGIIEPSP